MSDRILAHVEKVISVEEIPGANNIELCRLLGWQCIIKKSDNIKVNDLVGYCEIDSILPEIPEWEFLKDTKYRIKTRKFMKTLSQGLVIPLKYDKDCERYYIPNEYISNTPCGSRVYIQEGSDITELLGITKWLPPDEREPDQGSFQNRKKYGWFIRYMTRFQWFRKLFKKRSRSFPEYPPVSDETRIQSMHYNKLYELNKDKKFYISEKLDGQSSLYIMRKKRFKWSFEIYSRTVRKFELDNSNWSVAARKFDIKNKLRSLNKNIAIQGELIGPKIQGNKYKIEDFDLYIFNVFDMDKKVPYSLDKAIEIVNKLNLKFVPILDKNFKLLPTVDEMLALADGESTLCKTLREGLVFRTYDKSISFKAVSNKFLLKHGE